MYRLHRPGEGQNRFRAQSIMVRFNLAPCNNNNLCSLLGDGVPECQIYSLQQNIPHPSCSSTYLFIHTPELYIHAPLVS